MSGIITAPGCAVQRRAGSVREAKLLPAAKAQKTRAGLEANSWRSESPTQREITF